jgi:hypothetical protein
MVDIENVARLTTRIKELRTLCVGDGTALINTYHWDRKKDLRITSNIRLLRMITGLHVSFLYLSNLDQNAILEGIKLPFEENMDIEQYLLSNEVFLKLGFSSSLFFIVEGVLKNYLQFLDEKTYKNTKGIKNVCTCLLEEKLEWDLVKFDCSVFDFLRLIRNTLHSNGIHLPLSAKEKDVQIRYKDKKYRFVDGERINFVTWDLLLDITNDMRLLLFHLANNKKIREIKSIIPDTYAL